VLFLRLAGGGDAPFAAFVDTGEWAVCSASPELFLRIDGERIESRPMKGTAARGLWSEDDQARKAALLDSEKERAENMMIVDMVRNDLGRVAEPGSVEVPALFTAEAYPAVWQLTSTVTARTRAPLDLSLAATFPPASITGAPKGRAKSIIAELETDPRRIYTGTIGWLVPGRHSQWNVAIRTVLVHKPSQTVEYGVGGGIVWDSTTAGEYGESEAKAKTLNPVPRTFDLLVTLLWTPRDGYALWDAHMARLARSGAFFGFMIDLRKIREALARVAAGLPPQACRVRLQVSRRGAVRCESVVLDAGSLSFTDVALAAGPFDRRDVFLYHKTSVRSVYESALRQRPGCSDVLLFNEAGEVTETTVANVAVEIGGVRYTPPVRCGLLPGTQRAVLLERGELRERVIRIEELREHPRVFLLNSVRGLHAVSVKSERA
jgi:para-aminobenzoate synthetase/4-amino-4-deoxychorismate lyase